MTRDDFPPIPDERARAILARLAGEPAHGFLGLHFEEIRADYARARLAFRPELLQYAGVVQGGVVAALIDSSVVGAVLSTHETWPTKLATLTLNVQFLEAVTDQDVVAEARVRRRGRTVCFLDIEARDATGREVAHGEVVMLVVS